MAKILIIDDDPDIVTAVRLTLESVGHKVVEAGSGKEGIARIKTDRPDLIILDVMMETQTEGFQVALKLHSSDPGSEFAVFKNIPILMFTAIHSTTPLRFEPDRDYLPVEAFIDKPVKPDLLIEKVDSILKGRKS